MNTLFRTTLLFIFSTSLTFAQNKEEKALINLLNEFLAKVETKVMHDRFWAEDLTYTSSSGKRHGKGTIMAGFNDNMQEPSSAGPTYWAEDIEIKIFGEVAIVAFRLMGNSPDGVSASYLNSGTFVKRNSEWKVVNWQATKTIP